MFADQARVTAPVLFGLLFAYKCAIELAYWLTLAPAYAYAGFNLNPDILSYVGVFALLLIVVLCLPKDTNRPSSYLFFILVLFVYVPLGSFCWIAGESLAYIFLVTLAFLFSFLVSKLRLPSLELHEFKASRLICLVFVFYLFVVLYLVFSAGGPDVRTLDFSNVYEIRGEGSVTGIAGYLLNWTAKVFGPFFFVYYLFRGKKCTAVIPLILQVLLYLTFAMKAYLFSAVLLLFFFLAFKKWNFVKCVPICFATIVLVGVVLAVCFDLTFLRGMWVYRMTYEPAKVEFWFFNFFQDNPHLLFSEGLIGKMLGISSPYPTTVTYVISGLHGNEYNCNTGMFSDAYSQGGFLVMIILLALFGLLMTLIDAVSSRIPVPLVVVMFSYLMINLMDGSLLTTLLTGGLGLMIVMVFLFNSDLAQKSQCRILPTQVNL